MKEKTKISFKWLIISLICGVYAMSLSVKYLYEVFVLGCVEYYQSWIYPVLDFGILIFVGVLWIAYIIFNHQWKAVFSWEETK